jgi:hypothetical protein
VLFNGAAGLQNVDSTARNTEARSMATKVRIPNPSNPGQSVEGEVIDVKSSSEPWSDYELADGTRLRIRMVVHQVIRLAEHNAVGEPVYAVKSTNILDVDVPEILKIKGRN